MATPAAVPSLTVTAMAKVGNTSHAVAARWQPCFCIVSHCGRGGDKVPLSATTPANWLTHCYACHRFPANNPTSALFTDDLLHWKWVFMQVWPVTKWGWTHTLNNADATRPHMIVGSTLHRNNSNDGGSRCLPPPPCPACLSCVRGHRLILSMPLCSPSMGPW